MIGKITIGKSFKGCLLYCLNDKRGVKDDMVMKDRAEVLLFNKCYGNQKDLVKQFNDARNLNTRLSKPVMHITLSLAKGDQLSKEKLVEMSQHCAREMSFENNQYVAILHKDTTHPHIHIVANRVGFDGKSVSDSKNYQKIAAFCRKMEKQYGLKQVLSPRSFLPQEMRDIPRLDARKEKLTQDIYLSLLTSPNYKEFEARMKAIGYQVLKGRGIAFVDPQKVKIKGSEVGYSLMEIERVFAFKAKIQQGLKQQLIQQLRVNKEVSQKNNRSLEKSNGNDHGKENKPLKQVEDLLPNRRPGDLLEELLRPDRRNENFLPEWLKKKMKQKKGYHL